MRGHPTAMERFWAKFQKDPDSGCWLWTGGVGAHGYGRFGFDRRTVYAHRFAYETMVGPIPDGHVIDHVRARGCRYTHCVNPSHLEAVTPEENVARGDSHAGGRPCGHPLCRRCAVEAVAS